MLFYKSCFTLQLHKCAQEQQSQKTYASQFRNLHVLNYSYICPPAAPICPGAATLGLSSFMINKIYLNNLICILFLEICSHPVRYFRCPPAAHKLVPRSSNCFSTKDILLSSCTDVPRSSDFRYVRSYSLREEMKPRPHMASPL